MFVLLILFFLATWTISLYLKTKKALEYWKGWNIPHVEPWSIIRSLKSLVFGKTSYTALLEDFYRQYSMHRVCGWFHFLKPVLVINDINLIERICIKDFDKFYAHFELMPRGIDPFWDNALFNRKGKDWHKARTMASPAFSDKKLKAMFELMTHYAQKLLIYLEKDKSSAVMLETRSTFEKVANDIIASCVFGIECNSLANPNNEIYQTLKRSFDLSGFNFLKLLTVGISPFLSKMLNVTMYGEKGMKFFRRVLREAIVYREENGLMGPDIISSWKRVQKDKLQNNINSLECNENKKTVMTDEDILCQAVALSFAGYNSSSGLLTRLVKEVAANTDIQEKLINEVDEILTACNGKITYEMLGKMKYLDMVVFESLRKQSAIFLNRSCVKTTTIEPVLPGQRPFVIEEGVDCIIPISAIHKDPKYFPAPEKFDPERFSDENKQKLKRSVLNPFGVGPRMCIGNRFAQLQVKIIVLSLLSKFKVLSIDKTTLRNNSFLRFNEDDDNYWVVLERRSNHC